MLAQKAFFDKNPDAIELIQTSDQINLDESDKIYLVTDNKSEINEDLTNNVQIDEDES